MPVSGYGDVYIFGLNAERYAETAVLGLFFGLAFAVGGKVFGRDRI